MKRSTVRSSTTAATLVAVMLAMTSAFGQGDAQIITIPLSSPGEPYELDIDILSARIEVIGEARQDMEFAITVEQGNRKIITPSGTQPITIGAYELEVDEDDNRVSVDADWRANKVTVVARVPQRGNLYLSTVNDGEIIVRDVAGNHELENTNGPITATGINGSVIAESINDTIDVSFTGIDGSQAMSFTSINGDIELGLPRNVGAQFHIDTSEGEIYSDFEVDVQASEPVVERRENRGGVSVKVESVIIANVNGGGPVIRIETLNGDISINDSGN